MVLPKNGKVAVLGAGISGLSYAHFLGNLRPDVNITIMEKMNRTGGWINTERANSSTISKLRLNEKLQRTLRMERGPRTLRGVSPGTLIIADLLSRAGKLNELRGVHIGSVGNRKFLLGRDKLSGSSGHISGKLVAVPGGGGQGLAQTVNFFATEPGMHILKGMVKDVMFRKDGEDLATMTVGRFFERHFGKGMAEESVSALMYGIYASDINDMSIQCVFPSLVDIEKKHGSIVRGLIKREKVVDEVHPTVQKYLDLFGGSEANVNSLSKLLKKFPMLAFQSGLSGVTNALRDSLPSNVKIVEGVDIDKVSTDGTVSTTDGGSVKYDHVRSTGSVLELSSIVDKKVGDLLSDFSYTSITVVNVLIPKSNLKQATGFGFLVPKACLYKDTPLMGVIFDSDVEEHSTVLFPNGEIPEVLKTESSKESIEALAKSIAAREGEDISEECTKMTFMFQVPRHGPPSTPAAITTVIKDTLSTILNMDVDPSEIAIECFTHKDAIPLYDIDFIARRKEVCKMTAKCYGDRLSLGGMVFAPGVGVPDAVVGSLEAASELCTK